MNVAEMLTDEIEQRAAKLYESLSEVSLLVDATSPIRQRAERVLAECGEDYVNYLIRRATGQGVTRQ